MLKIQCRSGKEIRYWCTVYFFIGGCAHHYYIMTFQMVASLNIFITIAVSEITVHPTGPITVVEGSNVDLNCKATGDEPLNYQWMREPESLPDNVKGKMTPNITICNITINDGGKYYCIVDSGGESMPSMKVEVTVKSESLIINYIMFNLLHTEKPSITDSPSDQQLSIISGNQQVTLTCKVTGDDIAGGYWERMDDVQYMNRNNKSSLSDDKKTVTIKITKARPEHSGEYRCIAYSQWGVAQSRNIQVTITSESNNVLM